MCLTFHSSGCFFDGIQSYNSFTCCSCKGLHLTVGNQVYSSALWAIRCTPVHYGQPGIHQCTLGNQMYSSALWAIRCTPDKKFNVMLFTWWWSPCASERGLTNGFGHSSTYCISAINWKCNAKMYLNFIVSGVASSQGWNILVLYLIQPVK